jgi:hypothetical protein
MNWNEDPITGGALHERMSNYIDYDIQKYFGLSFHEFIEQPTYVIIMQLEIAESRIKRDEPLNNAARQALQGLSENKSK